LKGPKSRKTLLVGELYLLHDLRRIKQTTLVILYILFQPVSVRNALAYRNAHVDWHTAAARLVEEDDHFRIARFIQSGRRLSSILQPQMKCKHGSTGRCS
jgi:hypothetical protein